MIPSIDTIRSIPLARAGEYELSEKETRTLRSRIYAINKDGVCRFRTMRDGNYTIVWRIK